LESHGSGFCLCLRAALEQLRDVFQKLVDCRQSGQGRHYDKRKLGMPKEWIGWGVESLKEMVEIKEIG